MLKYLDKNLILKIDKKMNKEEVLNYMIDLITEKTKLVNNKESFILDHPSKGLYIPKLVWRDIHFTHNAVLLCLASEYYTEDDYFRNYEEFKFFVSNFQFLYLSFIFIFQENEKNNHLIIFFNSFFFRLRLKFEYSFFGDLLF